MNRDYGHTNNEYAGSVDVTVESIVYRPRVRPRIQTDTSGGEEAHTRDSFLSMSSVSMPSVVWKAYSSFESSEDLQVGDILDDVHEYLVLMFAYFFRFALHQLV